MTRSCLIISSLVWWRLRQTVQTEALSFSWMYAKLCSTPAFWWFLVWLPLRSWRGRRYVYAKCMGFSKLYCVAIRKIVHFIITPSLKGRIADRNENWPKKERKRNASCTCGGPRFCKRDCDTGAVSDAQEIRLPSFVVLWSQGFISGGLICCWMCW